MKQEIIKAAVNKLYIITFSKDMYTQTQALVSNCSGNPDFVKLDTDNEFMSLSDPLLSIEGGGVK